ncbi:MAG: ammonium transporter [Pseudomonadota bacterium]|uniref:Ammonium transporter AmtB-like domain-containing protein n=1 Tax=marine metagenome TaxID=408172 RepID=A0A381REU3_9ZZZZ|nr:ammonia channel protein [Gammaproteobacteria bacterium]MEC8833932.1 ammonium transporter [Pseudomonadota bacterium]HCP49826.1 ammonia channel protein [Gammaproteobacteria bacterium]|tara:strand:+ start:5052 stop:6359 length:1308 start_codon:yes stop_codon:yes gene_type:complete
MKFGVSDWIQQVKRIAVVALILGVNWANADELNTGDTAWILTSTALVLFMTIPGLSLFYGGLVRSRNVLSVLMQCFSITCVVTILWLLIGYSLAFDVGNSFIGGLSKGLFAGVDEGAVVGTIPESSFAIFQLTFAIITPALIVGGFAERMRFVSVLAFTALWSIIVYAPITHWVWAEGGWLFERGFLDFAGGSVVHMTAGTAAVVTALVLKARQGFPTQPMPPHNMTLTMAGAGMLWVGWFGFNGGSALTAGGNAAMAIAVTHISAAAGAFTWMSVEWIKYGKPSALGAVTGMVAGLGTITPASGFVGPAGALVIGVAAGLVCFYATNIMKQKLKIDDSLDVFPVHGVGGFLGIMLTAIFASKTLGIFSGQEDISIGSQLLTQFIGAVAVMAYTALATWAILLLVGRLAGTNRVTGDNEVLGLDLSEHNERGYVL